MRRLLFFAALLALISSCGQTGYRYTESGMKYKIISGGGKDTLRHGDMIKVFIESRYEDSVLMSSSETGYQLFPYDSNMAKQKYNATEIFPLMKIGDSAVCVFKSDTIINMQFGPKPPEGAIPPWLKRGKNFYMFVKIVQKYTDTAAFNRDREKEYEKFQVYQNKMREKMMAEQAKKDSLGFAGARAEFDKYLGDKKSKLPKTAHGAYVEFLEPGTGAPCDSGKIAALRYRGTLLNGEEFDSNFPKPGDKATPPALQVPVGMGTTIPGFDEAVAMLRVGSHVKVYIPSEAGYAGQGSGPKVKPYSNLVFDLTVESVTVPKPPPPMNMQQQSQVPPPPPPPGVH